MAQLEAALRTGGMPCHPAAMRHLKDGLRRISSAYPAWERRRPSDRDLAIRFAAISKVLTEAEELLSDDPQLILASAFTAEQEWRGKRHAPISFDGWRRLLTLLHTFIDVADVNVMAYAAREPEAQPDRQIDPKADPKIARKIGDITNTHERAMVVGSRLHPKEPKEPDTEPQNWVFRELYLLACEIRGREPGIAAPFYRFVASCVKMMALELPAGTEAAFLQRAKRLRPGWHELVQAIKENSSKTGQKPPA